jgi:hypothetical protein
MATVRESPRKAEADKRFVIYGVDWDTYDAISRALGDHRTRLTFDGENLELMSPSPICEWSANLLGRMLEALALELDTPIRGGGSTTFKRSSEGDLEWPGDIVDARGYSGPIHLKPTLAALCLTPPSPPLRRGGERTERTGEAACDFGRGFGAANRTADGNASGAGRNNLVDIVGADAADGVCGQRDFGRHLPD